MLTPCPPAALARRAARDTSAVAAVEFALVLPLLLVLYVGAVDVTRAVLASRNVTLLSRTVSDLVSQQSTSTPVAASTVSLIFGASSAVMAPYSTTGLKLTVSAVDIKLKSDGRTCCQALVRWSYTQGGTLRACTNPLTQVADGTRAAATNIPASIITANSNGGFNYASGSTSYLIVADISYTYVPFFPTLPPPLGNPSDWFKPGMSRTTWMVPRSPSGPITLASPVVAGTGQSGVVCF